MHINIHGQGRGRGGRVVRHRLVAQPASDKGNQRVFSLVLALFFATSTGCACLDGRTSLTWWGVWRSVVVFTDSVRFVWPKACRWPAERAVRVHDGSNVEWLWGGGRGGVGAEKPASYIKMIQ